MKKLSIVVLTYNHEEFIKENLEGIFMQETNFPVELIISDDASKDKTVEIIEETVKNVPENFEIKFIKHQKNLGSTPNFYSALKHVSGEYVAFCEGDDYWTDAKKLQLQYDFLEKNPGYSLCFHKAINVSPDKNIDGTEFSKVENRDYTTLEIYKNWVVHTATVMMKSEVLDSEAKKTTMQDDTLQYFDTVLYMAASTIGKVRGMDLAMSAYRRHDLGLSAGKRNANRDLKHNKLDKIIGDYYQGEIKKFSDWQIFIRSRLNFLELIHLHHYRLASKFVPWLLRNKILLYFILKNKK